MKFIWIPFFTSANPAPPPPRCFVWHRPIDPAVIVPHDNVILCSKLWQNVPFYLQGQILLAVYSVPGICSLCASSVLDVESVLWTSWEGLLCSSLFRLLYLFLYLSVAPFRSYLLRLVLKIKNPVSCVCYFPSHSPRRFCLQNFIL
jgi:hypothetical protein